MPKTINSPRHELLCGKVEEAIEILEQLNKFATNSKIEPKLVDLYELLVNIKHDGQRMEHKLALRKGQVRELRTQLCGHHRAVTQALNSYPSRIAPYTKTMLQQVHADLTAKGDEFILHDDGTPPDYDFD